MPTDPLQVGAGAALTAVFGGGGFWAWIASRPKNQADLITVAQNAAKEVIEGLRSEIDRQEQRIAALEAKVESYRQEAHDFRNEATAQKGRAERAERALTAEQEAHAVTRAELERERGRREQVEGENRQLKQTVDSMRAVAAA